MAAVVIRNLPEATHRALKERAKRHGRSTEAEIREIIEAAVKPGEEKGEGLGTELHKLWAETGRWQLNLPPRAAPVRVVDFSLPEFGEPDDDDP